MPTAHLCLLLVVIPFTQDFGNDLICIEGNASLHGAVSVDEVVPEHNVESMVRLPHFRLHSDRRRVGSSANSSRLNYSSTLYELKVALLER
jgi:hypothetical protein